MNSCHAQPWHTNSITHVTCCSVSCYIFTKNFWHSINAESPSFLAAPLSVFCLLISIMILVSFELLLSIVTSIQLVNQNYHLIFQKSIRITTRSQASISIVIAVMITCLLSSLIMVASISLHCTITIVVL